MRNLGSTCFMSVILQSFIHNPPLRAYFLSDKHNPNRCPNERSTCLACQMDNLFSHLYSGETKPFAPHEFLWSMWMSCSQLVGYAQQDAHEFFIGALNGIHNSLEMAEGAGNSRYQSHECPCIIHRIFSGVFQSTVTCLQCGNETHANDPFLDMSLDVRPVLSPHLYQPKGRASTPIMRTSVSPDTSPQPSRPPTATGMIKSTGKSRSGPPSPISTSNAAPARHDLYECLDRFTHQEHLGPLEYKCSRCQNVPQPGSPHGAMLGASKQLSLKKLPLVLCLQLKRFDHRAFLNASAFTSMLSGATAANTSKNNDEDSSSKIDQFIHFPLDLDLSPYTTRGVHLRNQKKNGANVNISPDAEIKRSSYLYSLFAVIVHHGTINSGHYTCYVRQSGGTNQWFRFNDQMVVAVDWEEVSRCQAYVMKLL